MKTLGNASRIYPPRTIGVGPTMDVAYTDLANIFTLAQRISLATAGTIFQADTTENNASAQVLDYYRHRNGAAGQDGDDLTELQFNGLDDNASPAKTKYARLLAEIIDASDTTEDGALRIGTVRAGTLVDWFFQSGTFAYQGLVVPSSAGVINAVGYQVSGVALSGGNIIRHGRTNFTTHSTITAVMANDDSIPQITEGAEIATLVVTPRSASSILRLKSGLVWTTNGATISPVVGIFVDATANAVAATPFLSENSTTVVNSSMYEWEISAGSTSARTYRMRVGPGTAGSVFLNGDAAARQLSGLSQCFLSVEEVLP